MRFKHPSKIVALHVEDVEQTAASYIGSTYGIMCYQRGVDLVAEHLMNALSEIQEWRDLVKKVGLTFYFWKQENPMKVYETPYQVWVKNYLRPDIIKRLNRNQT